VGIPQYGASTGGGGGKGGFFGGGGGGGGGGEGDPMKGFTYLFAFLLFGALAARARPPASASRSPNLCCLNCHLPPADVRVGARVYVCPQAAA
jgi:hypothetical protein